MLTILAESALRSLVLGSVVWVGLNLLRARNPHVHMTSWVMVLVASLSMPFLMHWTTVTVTLDSIPKLATLDQAPVNVNITTQRAANVLAVPVNALLALQGGGFGVQVMTGNTGHLVGVTTGLYANNLVQISGSGISVGTRVEVPSS